MSISAAARIRELWPLVLALRREGVSWRHVPRQMHERYGMPVVSHALYLRLAKSDPRGSVVR